MSEITHAELVEKVARSLCAAEGFDPDGRLNNGVWQKAMKYQEEHGDLPDDWKNWSPWVPQALAAISTIADALKEPTEAQTHDQEGYEIKHYKIVYFVELGWIGDSEGRTWAKDLKESTPFATRDAADAYASAHPEITRDWDGWLRAKYDYGQARIRRAEIPVSAVDALRAMLAASPLFKEGE